MSRNNNRNLNPRAHGYSKRRVNTQDPDDRLLIVSEGKRTEPLYFKSFPVVSARVDVVGLGMNTLSIVYEAIRLRDQASADGVAFDQVWCVFDRDSFPIKRVKAALDLARQEGIKVAFTNEAFELWPLLHFIYCDAALARKQYQAKLSVHLPAPYRKNDPNLYRYLWPHIEQALKHADKLAKQRPAHENPSTTVHLLVRELLRLMKRRLR